MVAFAFRYSSLAALVAALFAPFYYGLLFGTTDGILLAVVAMAALLIRQPENFDVVVTTNLFGDILSDEAAELSGGLGLGGSINASHDHAVAQAAHGSAPDIAGQNKANPTALVISAQMLLKWNANRSGNNQLAHAAAHLEAALDDVLADPANHTMDMEGSTRTDEFGEVLARAVDQ